MYMYVHDIILHVASYPILSELQYYVYDTRLEWQLDYTW